MSCGSRQAVLVFLLSLIGACYVHGQDGDECNQYLLCDECIAASGDCVWCSDPPPFSGSRCTSSQDAECLSELEDPVAQPPETLKDDPLGETVQISPQEIRLNLRTGKRQTFTLSVKPARNYPLDMFFLMDLSGSQAPDLAMLRNLSNSIIEQLENISSQFHLGFSSFVDKIAYPFASILQNESDYLENHIGNMRIQCANGRDSCDPTYVFRLHLPLTNDETQFREVLEKATIRGNLDAPEATLEALLQTVACRENMGWRNGSLRIVMVLTDAGFKTALDGKVATLLTRNDGRCHLETTPNEDGFYEYFRSPEQDFPSIYQVREKIIENDIITIFAIAKNITDEVSEEDIYELLAEELGSSRSFVQTIRNDSSDIVSVIREAYESITRDIVVESVSGLTIVEINPVLNCSLTVDGMGCANVAIEQLVRFNVTVVMESCLSETTTVLSLPGFGNVDLTLVPICECNCTSQEESPRHKDCSSEGSLSCGICNCVAGRYGEQCECNEPLGPCPDNCFNRGTCDECMRVCTSCDTEEVEVDGVVQILGSYGERCECDNETSGACPSGMGSVCSGRGACECSSEDGCECRCECGLAPLSGLPYSGPDCSCDPDNCHNSQFPNRLCAHTRGEDRDGECECGCGECQCEKDFVSYNRTCRHNDDLCAMFEECARCWPMNCTRGDCHPSSLDDIVSNEGAEVTCQIDQGGCVVDFQVQLSGPSNTLGSVFVREARDCQEELDLSRLAWIIAVSIVGGILLLGVLLLAIAKCIFMVYDRHEYKRFLEDMHTGDFTPGTEERLELAIYETVDSVPPPPSTQPTYEEVDVVREARGSRDIQLTFNEAYGPMPKQNIQTLPNSAYGQL